MIMCSSAAADKGFFLVQSGIVAWEDPHPVAEWPLKTVSLCSRRLAELASALHEIILARSSLGYAIYRFHTTLVASEVGAVQRMRLIKSLCANVPGFDDTVVTSNLNRTCAISKLIHPGNLDLRYLSSYRNTILVETGFDSTSLMALCGKITEFDATGIAALIKQTAATAIVRILELQSFCVAQVIGDTQAAKDVVKILTDAHVAQIHDVRNLPFAITELCNQLPG